MLTNRARFVLQRRNKPHVMMRFRSVRRCVQKSAIVSLMSLDLGNVKYETYFSFHFDIDFFNLQMLHILKGKSSSRKNKLKNPKIKFYSQRQSWLEFWILENCKRLKTGCLYTHFEQ